MLSGCVDADIEQHLYNNVGNNMPIFTPEPIMIEIQSCMDFIYDWITERHLLDIRRMELFKLTQEQGNRWSHTPNRISDLADKYELNEISQQEIMAMIFICSCRSTRFSWQFIRKEGAGWDRASCCEEQNGDNKALAITKKPSQTSLISLIPQCLWNFLR